MYAQEYLAKERDRERLRQAEYGRATYQVAKLRRLEKQMARAERQLLNAWERTEQLWSVMREG